MKNLEIVKGYSVEKLKAIYDEAVKETEERWYGPNGDGISRYDQSEKFGGLISMICVNEDNEIFHYYDLPWNSDTSLPAEIYNSHKIYFVGYYIQFCTNNIIFHFASLIVLFVKNFHFTFFIGKFMKNINILA